MTRLSIFLSLFLFNSSISEPIRISLDMDQEAILIDGVNLSEAEAQEFILVYFGELKDHPNQPTVIGSFEVNGSKVRFKPKYGFSQGSVYSVIVKVSGFKNQHQTFRVPKPEKYPSTRVVQVYPTSSRLPMNQLKFYIEFSAPMRSGYAYENLTLYRLPNEELEKEAFLVMPEELWNQDRTRLTLFFDPGRIKSGVEPNLQLGLPLVEGRRYKLEIDKNWLDANGVELLNDFEKEFAVGPVDREVPDSDQWTILTPHRGTMESLTINFHESMDYGLLHSSFLVLDLDQNPIHGKISVSQNESRWHFIPDEPWKDVKYDLVVNSWLEDLAGNNLNRKFDVDLNDAEDRPKNISQVKIPINLTNESN